MDKSDEGRKLDDRARQEIILLHNVTGWIIRHYDDFPKNLYELDNNDYIPFSMGRYLKDLAHQDSIDPLSIIANWPKFIEESGE